MRIHVLTPGFTSPNGRAFLFPLVVWRRAPAAAGFEVRLFDRLEAVEPADAILVDSKFHKSRWKTDPDGILADFVRLRERADRVIYCDTTDSSGWIQVELLSVVDRYWKFQLLRDRSLYLRPMYGHRIFADYYHRTRGVTDAVPESSVPVADPALLDKLAVTWNSGLADYSLFGPARMAAYLRLPCPALLRFSARAFVAPERPRSNEVSCRFGIIYPRESVAWQRREVRRLLADRLPTDKLGRRAYFAELADSRVIVSPFGFGEITLKDFEVFLTGGLLLKPDMSHMETWPDLFRAGETMAAHSWDLDDLTETIAAVLADEDRRLELARAGQAFYRRHTAGPEAPHLFCDHLRALLAD